jgi:hypothetical protein
LLDLANLSKFAAISAMYWDIKSRRQKFKNLPARGIDPKIGLSEKVAENADIMWINLKKLYESSSDDQKFGIKSDLLKGTSFQPYNCIANPCIYIA